MQRIFKISKKEKSSTYINYGNGEIQTQKSLIPKQRLNCFDHKHYERRWILKFEFVFIVNNVDCNTRWSMSFCLSTRMDNLLGMNHTKHLIRHNGKNKKKLENELLHLSLTL